jgi:hypothetical protein
VVGRRDLIERRCRGCRSECQGRAVRCKRTIAIGRIRRSLVVSSTATLNSASAKNGGPSVLAWIGVLGSHAMPPPARIPSWTRSPIRANGSIRCASAPVIRTSVAPCTSWWHKSPSSLDPRS